MCNMKAREKKSSMMFRYVITTTIYFYCVIFLSCQCGLSNCSWLRFNEVLVTLVSPSFIFSSYLVWSLQHSLLLPLFLSFLFLLLLHTFFSLLFSLIFSSLLPYTFIPFCATLNSSNSPSSFLHFCNSPLSHHATAQLDVKGCSDIYESLRKYTGKEMLDGDNQYDAGPELGKQDAEKGVIFTKFPPVLTVHLKRFDFDLQRMVWYLMAAFLAFILSVCSLLGLYFLLHLYLLLFELFDRSFVSLLLSLLLHAHVLPYLI